MLSVSESDVSIVSGKLFAFDKYVLQSGAPNAVLSLAPLKYQIMIRNNPTEVLGVREGVLLIFTKTNEQMSSNSSTPVLNIFSCDTDIF